VLFLCVAEAVYVLTGFKDLALEVCVTIQLSLTGQTLGNETNRRDFLLVCKTVLKL
jgi:hypothetical protein